MEIEAKYRVPDSDLFRRLTLAEELAGFTLVPAVRSSLLDLYLDTPDHRILRSGYACRLRTSDDGILVTLKGFGRVYDGIHYREEIEVRLAEADPDPRHWPAGPAQSTALELAGTAAMLPLLTLKQTRETFRVCQGSRLVGELSLDQVWSSSASTNESYLELEIELGSDGLVTDLKAVQACLLDEWGLQPETGSKFERALREAVSTSHQSAGSGSEQTAPNLPQS